jgi:hypothetical protein
LLNKTQALLYHTPPQNVEGKNQSWTFNFLGKEKHLVKNHFLYGWNLTEVVKPNSHIHNQWGQLCMNLVTSIIYEYRVRGEKNSNMTWI